jgi:hypothetical protein
MLALIDGGKALEAHPAVWAPFIVVGEGASVSGGAKVGQWSGGVGLPRGGVITGHWLV